LQRHSRTGPIYPPGPLPFGDWATPLGMLITDLIAGPYVAPALKRGDRAFCLYRDCDVVVTNWTDARISWPRCRAIGSGAGSGLLVNDELARAIKTESAVALKHWFGVGTHAVWKWRKAFGIGRTGTKGSRLLHERTAQIVRDLLKGGDSSLGSGGQIALVPINDPPNRLDSLKVR
jgi:hypothetical protein